VDECKFEDEGIEPAAIVFGDGSQSRSKTQEIDDDDRSDFDVAESSDLLNRSATSHLEDSRVETFDDEDAPGNSSMRLNASSSGNFYNNSYRSRGRKSPLGKVPDSSQQKEFVRIPRNLGKKQRSEDIMTFQEIPTTF
jgi:hypothetical protein